MSQIIALGHSTKDSEGCQDWVMCQFTTAVQREVGNHFEELSIAMERSCSIAPGKPSLRNFKNKNKIQSLELPIDTVICGFTAAELADYEPLYSESILGDIILPSVSELSLLLHRKKHHDKALDLLFRDFATQKHLRMPLLKEIRLIYPNDADDLFKAQFTNLVAETEVGVALNLTIYSYREA